MFKTFYHLRGALGDLALLDAHQDAINNLLQGNYTKKNIEKLRGHDIYSLRLGDAERLLFTTIKINGEEYLLILDYLPTHDYHKSRFLRSGVLRDYLEKNAEAYQEVVREQFVFEAVAEDQYQERMRAVGIAENANPPDVLDYYQQRIIALNAYQKEALKVKPPTLISGVAGSGKSSVALSLLVEYIGSQGNAILEEEEAPRRVLYVSQSPHLVNTIKAAWVSLPIAVDNPHQVDFLTYDELVKRDAGEQAVLASKEQFDEWYASYITHQKKIAKAAQTLCTVIDKEILYQEFRICSGYSEQDYLQLGLQQSLIEKKMRPWVYQAYQAYLTSPGIKSAFYVFQAQDLYDLVVFDEAQDASHQGLKNAYQLAKSRAIVYCMDSHQRLRDIRSVRPYLLALIQPDGHHLQLETTYRCPPKIVHIANEVIAFKHRLAGGITDKNEITKIESIGEEKGAIGQVFVVNKQQLSGCNWVRQDKGTQFAVVTSEEYLEEAKQYFNTQLVFTPESIKGLEFKVVVAYHLYDANLFQQAQKRVTTLGDSKQPIHQAKAGEEDERFVILCNHIYTSYTRATKTLVICEENNRNNQPLLERFYPSANEGLPLLNDIEHHSTPDDWRQEITKQFQVGNGKLAQNLFLTHLGTLEEYQVFIASFNEKSLVHTPNPITTEKASSPQEVKANPTSKLNQATSLKYAKSQTPTASAARVIKRHPVATQAESLPPIEKLYAEKLYQEFTLQNLITILKIPRCNLTKLLLEKYITDGGGYKCSLIEFIDQDSARSKLFFSCLVNNAYLVERIPLSDCLNQRSLKKTFKTNLQWMLDCHKPFEQDYFEREHRNHGMTWAYALAGLNQIDLLRKIHRLGADLNQPLNNGATPAYIAAENNRVEVLRVLKELGADLNQAINDGATPAYIAAENNHVEVLRVLKELGADLNQAMNDGATPAYIAAHQNQVEALRVLKELGADLNKANNNGATPAYIAAQQSCVEALRVLYELGADLNQPEKDGATPAYIAAYQNHVNALRVLKELGADLNQSMNDGATPAFIAAYKNQFESLGVLYELGADLNQPQKDGETPAYIAAHQDHVDALRVLKESGADLNKANNNGATPAFIAAQRGHLATIQYLIEMKANLHIPFVSTRDSLTEWAKKESPEVQKRMLEKIQEKETVTQDKTRVSLSILDIALIKGHAAIVAVLTDAMEKEPILSRYSLFHSPEPATKEEVSIVVQNSIIKSG